MRTRPNLLPLPRPLLCLCAALFSLFCFHGSALALTEAQSGRLKQLEEVIEFLGGEERELYMVIAQFPDLAAEAGESLRLFNTTYLAESKNGALDEMEAILGEKGPQARAALELKIKNNLFEDLNRNLARGIILMVKKQARGQLPEAYLVPVLSCVPSYRKFPGKELKDGWKQDYRVRNQPLAPDLDFSLSLPVTWCKEENTGRGLQTFASQIEEAPTSLTIDLKKSSSLDNRMPSREQLARDLPPEEARRMLPKPSTILETKSMVLLDMPGQMIVYDLPGENADASGSIRHTDFYFLHGDVFIVLQFSVSDEKKSAGTLADLQTRSLPLYKLIAGSLVLPRHREDLPEEQPPELPIKKEPPADEWKPNQTMLSFPRPWTKSIVATAADVH